MRFDVELVMNFDTDSEESAESIANEMVAMLERRFHKQGTSGFIDRLYEEA